MKIKIWFAFVLTAVFFGSTSCILKNEDEVEELGQQIGDTMASVDEAGGSEGSFPIAGLFRSGGIRISRLEGASKNIFDFIPLAHAESCKTANTFSGNCVSKTVTRTFGGCTIGAATFEGTVLLTYTNSNNNCKIDDDGESIARSPDFTVTGRRGATLSVTRIGTQGQLISRTGATSFTFENDGIRREFTTGGGQTLFRFTTQTTSAIGISGVSRDDRVVNGGTLKITNNLTNDFCSVSPNNVTWQTGCNCAVSGNWAGTCSDGDSVAMVLQGCGQATITKGSVETSIIFDRCYSTL